MNGNARKNAKGPVKNETPDEEIKVSHSNVHVRFMRTDCLRRDIFKREKKPF